jgi:hypothetical protein
LARAHRKAHATLFRSSIKLIQLVLHLDDLHNARPPAGSLPLRRSPHRRSYPHR